MAEAWRMRAFAALRFHDERHIATWMFWRMVMRMHWLVIRYAWSSWQNPRKHEESHDSRNAAFLFLEHRIRVLSIYQTWLSLLPNWMVEIVMRPFWAGILRKSQRIGYAKGIANSQKYCKRAGFSADKGSLLSRDVLYILLNDATGTTIALRDDALQLLKTCRSDPALIIAGREKTQEAIELAHRIGDPSLEIKCHNMLNSFDNSYAIPQDEFERLMAEIQSEAYRRIEDDLRRKIT